MYLALFHYNEELFNSLPKEYGPVPVAPIPFTSAELDEMRSRAVVVTRIDPNTGYAAVDKVELFARHQDVFEKFLEVNAHSVEKVGSEPQTIS